MVKSLLDCPNMWFAMIHTLKVVDFHLLSEEFLSPCPFTVLTMLDRLSVTCVRFMDGVTKL